jgi:transposase InsO family protein
VDFAGPFEYLPQRKWGARAITSVYVLVIICLLTRVVHLEFCFAVDKAEVWGPIQRFAARRKMHATFLSDGGASFIGAAEWLTEEKHTQGGWRGRRIKINHKMRRERVGRGVRWFFPPPEEPHLNGMAESLVKSVKRCLTRKYKTALFTIGEWLTVLAQVESPLNDRTVAAKNNPDDLDPITLNHL